MGCNTSQENPAAGTAAIDETTSPIKDHLMANDDGTGTDDSFNADNKCNAEAETIKLKTAPVADSEVIDDSDESATVPTLNGEPLGKDEGKCVFFFLNIFLK